MGHVSTMSNDKLDIAASAKSPGQQKGVVGILRTKTRMKL